MLTVAPGISLEWVIPAALQLLTVPPLTGRLHCRQVILDVVYNHVGNGSAIIHTAKHDFFILGPSGEHTNYSGCGNTMKCNRFVASLSPSSFPLPPSSLCFPLLLHTRAGQRPLPAIHH